MDELVDVLDEQGNPTGEQILKSEAHRLGILHPSVHVWFYNDQGQLLIQKRASGKEAHPGLWDVSVAGHVSAGEDSATAATREIREEIGMSYAPDLLEEIGMYPKKYELSGGRRDCEYCRIFIGRLNAPIDAFARQEEEVSDLRWIDLPALKTFVTSPDFVPHGKVYFQKVFDVLEPRCKVHRAGFVNIIGNPNVGKSTFMNALTGERLSIVTNKAQTTRHRILGIVNGEDFQLICSDTPGVIKPHYKLQNSMMDFVKTAFTDADIILYMTEPNDSPLKDEQLFLKIQKTDIPVLLLINKVDTVSQEAVEALAEAWALRLPKARIYPISAKTKFYIKETLQEIVRRLPVAPPYFPKDSLTDKPERFFAAEIIREKILLYYSKEIPYSVEVVIEAFTEEDDLVRIESVIITERESQKGIIIGRKGMALKKLSVKSRRDLENFFAKKVFLKIYIKVEKDWRNNPSLLNQYGYIS